MTKDKAKKLSTGKLTLIMYFLVSAGPYGIEEIMPKVGPCISLISICILFPILGFPVSVVCSEMGTFFSQVGSTVLWGQDIIFNMEHAMKSGIKINMHKYRFAKFFTKLYCLQLFIKAIIDNSLYPVMFCQYFASIWPVLDEMWPKIGVGCLCLLLVCILNIFSIDIVGWSQIAFVAIVITPVLLFVVMGFIFGRNTEDYFGISNRPKNLDFGALLGNLIWQCAGFDQMTNLSSEVANPRKSYPIAYLAVIILSMLTYMLPISSGTLFQPDHQKWDGDAFAIISKIIPHCANGWLYYWLIVGGGVSALAILNVSVSTTSREFYCNSMTGGLPFARWFGELSKKGCTCKRANIFKKSKKKQKEKERLDSSISGHVSSSKDFTVTESSRHQDTFESGAETLQVVEFNEELHQNQNIEVAENFIDGEDNKEQLQQFDPNNLQSIDYTNMGIIEEDEFNKLGLVPKRAVVALCLISVFLQVLPFDEIVEIDGFAFALNFLLQSFLYIYAKHGQFGYVRYHPEIREDKNIFYLNTKLHYTVSIAILPIIIACVMTYFCLWIGYVLLFGGLLIMFALYGIEVLVKQCKKKQQ